MRQFMQSQIWRWFLLSGCLCLGVFAYGDTSIILLDAEGLAAAMNQGIEKASPGEYTAWVWAKDTAPITVVMDGKSLNAPVPEKAQVGNYSWKKLGTCNVKSSENIPLQVYSNINTLVLEPETVGWLALSKDAEWNPETYFAWEKVFDHSIAPSHDSRLGVVRSIEKYYTFPGYSTKKEWLEHKQELETHILVSMGAYPTPEKHPLNPKIFDRIDRDGYSIEKVYFESLPGFYVTGNLYRPLGKQPPFPGIVSPHGHWGKGRLANEKDGSVPGRAINFARQGYVIFTYDMVGYVDSKQLDHKFGGPAEWLWGLSLHGLQFWNSVRAVDFVSTLPDVDPERIACTGASGGGTQTFFLSAVDERVKVAAPVNMLSAHYQGGCLCENAPNLRINAFNLEFGSMIAPRSLLMVSCTGDWTDETPRVEYPAIRSVYDLFDAGEHVHMVQMHADHNYNKDSREAVYAWFGKWLLNENNSEKLREKDFTVEPEENVRVFPERLPSQAITKDQLVAYWKEQSEQQLGKLFPEQKNTLDTLRRQMEPALQNVLGAKSPCRKELMIQRQGVVKQPDVFVEHVVIGRVGVGDQIPGVLLVPSRRNDKGDGTVLVHEKGKSGWFDSQTGKPGELLQNLLKQGHTVFMPDVFMTGEYDTPFEKAKRDTNASHFLTYNQTETALRVQDILTALAYMQSRYEAGKINLVGAGDAGLWCLLAAPLAQSLDALVVDAAAFPSTDDSAYLKRLFVPGLRRAGDVRTAQALVSPISLLIHNTSGYFDTLWAKSAYQADHAQAHLKIQESPADAETVVAWLK